MQIVQLYERRYTLMNRIKGLDGVRGIASIAVVAFHVAILGGYTDHSALFNQTIGRGDCFVRMFFILSSFSLLCAYYEKYLANNFNFEAFLIKRIKKIFPLFFIMMIAHSVMNILWGNPNNIFELIGTTSMLFAAMPSNQDSIVWGGWSMGIQMIFYLIFPFFLIVVKTKKRAHITFIVSALLLFAYLNFYSIGISNPHINIIRQFVYFAAGALIYHYKDYIENLTRKKKVFLSAICIFGELISFGLFTRINEDVVMLIAFSSLIILQIVGYDYLMNNVVLNFLGKISFEIYLVHTFVYRFHTFFSSGKLASLPPMFGFICHFLLIVVPTIIISYLLNRLIAQLLKKLEKTTLLTQNKSL